jgi:hypothetical protein
MQSLFFRTQGTYQLKNNAKNLGIFDGFDRVRLLKVSKVLPRGRAVFLLAAKLPNNG